MLKQYCFLALFIFTYATLIAQQGNVTGGGEASGPQGKVSFTIGQIDYQTATDTAGSVSQGLQQPFEIFIISGLEEDKITLVTTGNFSASVYPNPAQQFITLMIEGNTYANLTYQLYDMQWKLIHESAIESGQTKIELSVHATAGYFLKVNDPNKSLKIFKIIKQQ